MEHFLIGTEEFQLKDIDFCDLQSLKTLSIQLNRSTEKIRIFARDNGIPFLTVRYLTHKSKTGRDIANTYSFLEKTKLMNALLKDAIQSEKPQKKFLPKPTSLSSVGHRTKALHILQSQKDPLELIKSKTFTLPQVLALFLNLRLYSIATFQDGQLNNDCRMSENQLMDFDLARLKSFDKKRFRMKLETSTKAFIQIHSELNKNKEVSVESQLNLMLEYQQNDPLISTKRPLFLSKPKLDNGK